MRPEIPGQAVRSSAIPVPDSVSLGSVSPSLYKVALRKQNLEQEIAPDAPRLTSQRASSLTALDLTREAGHHRGLRLSSDPHAPFEVRVSI